MGDGARLGLAAKRAVELAGKGHRVVVVVSAQGDTTDELIEKAGCFNEGFEEAASHLTEEEQKIWWGFFDELDRLEAELEEVSKNGSE